MGGHPLHPAMTHFPIAFFLGALALTLLYLHTRNRDYEKAAFFALSGTLLGAAATVLTGIIDFAAVPIPKTTALANPAKYAMANIHMWLGLLFLIPAAAAFWLRYRDAAILDGPNRTFYLSLLIAGAVIVTVAGFTGWEANPYVQTIAK